jgi:hypothetical protein
MSQFRTLPFRGRKNIRPSDEIAQRLRRALAALTVSLIRMVAVELEDICCLLAGPFEIDNEHRMLAAFGMPTDIQVRNWKKCHSVRLSIVPLRHYPGSTLPIFK